VKRAKQKQKEPGQLKNPKAKIDPDPSLPSFSFLYFILLIFYQPRATDSLKTPDPSVGHQQTYCVRPPVV